MTVEIQRLDVAAADAGTRLDRYLAARLPDLSRTRIQELIGEGHVRVNGAAAKPSHRVAVGETVEIEPLPRPPLDAVAEAIPLSILYEDEDVVVVNKPAGMAVHGSAGNARGTLVNALVHRFGQLSAAGGALRPGIVHRLDKPTSGAIVVARNDAAHRHLAEQFHGRTVQKKYVALLHGSLAKDSGAIELAIARDLKRRTRMTTRRAAGREARTSWRVLARLATQGAKSRDGFTLVEAILHTGRTHQIRVHFSALGHPVVGDTLYGAPRQFRAGSQTFPPLGRNFLHAARICFIHPGSGKPVDVRAALPPELREYLERLARALGVAPSVIDAAARDSL
jgi:23S rRNA pseudouridine1911/1915/1917 synthase